MATNVRNIQQKLFRSDSPSLQNTSDSPKPDIPLTISIPKTVTPPPTLPSKVGKPQESNSSPTSQGNGPGLYRDRVRQKLGSVYKTVEQYRLDQDSKRERHWKRWGPYVSDRQWVCRCLFRYNSEPCVYHLSRQPSEKTILGTAMLGHTSPMSTLVRGPTGGEKTASRALVTTTSVSAFRFPCGTRRIECSKKGSSASQGLKGITEKMSRNCTITWILRRLTPT
jgi:hypothetical protein